MQVRKQQLELDMEQETCSKWGKEYVKAVYCHLVQAHLPFGLCSSPAVKRRLQALLPL